MVKSDSLTWLLSHFGLAMQGETPILLAASSRSGTKAVEYLIRLKANVNDVDNKVVRVLHPLVSMSFLY